MDTTVNFDLDNFQDEIENAPTAGFGPRMTYGLLTFNDIQIVSWASSNDGGPREMNSRPYVGGDKADKTKGEYIQITFGIDVQAINPKARAEGWTWERRVDMKQSSGNTKTDWSETVLKSFVAVLGADWFKKIKKGVWVEVEEPDTVERFTRDNPNKNQKRGELKSWTNDEGVTRINTSIRLLRVFKNKAECLAAFTERYSSKEETSADDEAAQPKRGKITKIPNKVAEEVRGILEAYDGDAESEDVAELLAEAPYNLYDFKALIKAAS